MNPEQIKQAKTIGALAENVRCAKVIQKFCFQHHQSGQCDCKQIIGAIEKGKTNE